MSRNGSKKRKLTPVLLGQLSVEDANAAQLRYGLWQAQQARANQEAQLAGLAQEAYTAFMADIAEKYDLPPTFNIDFATRNIEPTPEPSDG